MVEAQPPDTAIGTCGYCYVTTQWVAEKMACKESVSECGWSHKYDGLLADVGLAGNSVAIPYKRDAAKSQIAACIDGTETQKQTLRERVPDLCVRSENVLAAAIDVLR